MLEKFEKKTKNFLHSTTLTILMFLTFWYFFPRPLWVEFPEEKNTFSMEDEFLLGMIMSLNSCL